MRSAHDLSDVDEPATQTAASPGDRREVCPSCSASRPGGTSRTFDAAACACTAASPTATIQAAINRLYEKLKRL